MLNQSNFSIYDDTMTRTGAENASYERHFPLAFRIRAPVVREANAFAISSNLREPGCSFSRRKHSNLFTAIPAIALTVLTAISLPATSEAQPTSVSLSPTFPTTSTPVASPLGTLSQSPSSGPTANMTAVPSMLQASSGDPTTPAPISAMSDSPTATPSRIVSPSHRPTLSVNPTTAPTMSPAPTFPPSLNPTITPMPTGNPSASPTDFPSRSPSEVPSPSPTFDEESVGTTHLLQSFKVGNRRIFNDSEVFVFEDIMTGYTSNIAEGIDLSKINATCVVQSQTLLTDPERRSVRQRLLQDVVVNATNQVEFIMLWESYHFNVSEYPSLFSRYVESNLYNLTADLQGGGLDVLTASSLRAVITTEVPSAASSSIFKPTPYPVRPTTLQPSAAQSDTYLPTFGDSDEPSVTPANKPSNLGSSGSANVITNTVVIAVVLLALFVISCCGCFLFYHRRKQLKELEFQAAAAAGRLSSEKENKEAIVDRMEFLAVDAAAPYGEVPRFDDEQGIISPNESLLSNQSLISTGMSLGEGSIDEADRTHNLADAFDQYKDQNLEKVRADVQDLVIGSDSMMNQAMTLAFMGDEEIFADTRELISGGETDATEIEADLLCEVNDFLKRNEYADVEER
jgi:hypothetical protein